MKVFKNSVVIWSGVLTGDLRHSASKLGRVSAAASIGEMVDGFTTGMDEVVL